MLVIIKCTGLLLHALDVYVYLFFPMLFILKFVHFVPTSSTSVWRSLALFSVRDVGFSPDPAELQQEDEQQCSSHHSAAKGEAARFPDTCQKGQEAKLLSLQPEQQQGAAETPRFQRYLTAIISALSLGVCGIPLWLIKFEICLCSSFFSVCKTRM